MKSHIGSSVESWLQEEGLYRDRRRHRARAVASQIMQAMAERPRTLDASARRLKTLIGVRLDETEFFSWRSANVSPSPPPTYD